MLLAQPGFHPGVGQFSVPPPTRSPDRPCAPVWPTFVGVRAAAFLATLFALSVAWGLGMARAFAAGGGVAGSTRLALEALHRQPLVLPMAPHWVRCKYSTFI